MTADHDPLVVVRRRMQAQRLTGEPSPTPAEAVAWSGGVQAQEYAEALWSLGMRAGDCSMQDVAAACDAGEILRTHVLRPTWHFAAAADLRWLLRLTAARIQTGNAGRYRQLGLDPDTLARCNEVIAAALAGGEALTRRELGAALEAAGIDMTGQRLPHALLNAELEGGVASGPRRGKHHTYRLLDDRVPPAPDRSREDDVAELARRYFTSHGPATLRDFAWWSGLTMADGRDGVRAAGELLCVEEDDGGKAWIAGTHAAAARPRGPGAILLGTYDEMLVAYRDLRYVHADGRTSAAFPTRSILIDGRTVGTWRRVLARREVTIEATLETRLSADEHSALRAAAERFGAFLGLPARLKVMGE